MPAGRVAVATLTPPAFGMRAGRGWLEPERMRITYVTETYPPELNGVALTVKRTVDYLRSHGHEVDLIRPRQPGEAAWNRPREWRTIGLPIPLYPQLRYGIARISSLQARMKAFQPDLVHVATQGPLGYAAGRAAIRSGLPVTMDFRTNFHQYMAFYGLGWLGVPIAAYLRRFHNTANKTFVPTRELAGELARDGFQRLEVVGRGVDTSRFDPTRRDQALRARWGVAPDATAPVLLYVGRLAAEKNVPLVIEAHAVVMRAQPGARLVVVGDGPLKQELQKAGHANVIFMGALRGDELAQVYASADLFVFPSLSETFGNVVVEAMASRLHVIAFRVAAAGELIADEDCGTTVEPGNRAAFVTAVDDVARRFVEPLGHERIERSRDHARRVALETDWESVLSRFELHLESVVDEDKIADDTGEAAAVRAM